MKGLKYGGLALVALGLVVVIVGIVMLVGDDDSVASPRASSIAPTTAQPGESTTAVPSAAPTTGAPATTTKTSSTTSTTTTTTTLPPESPEEFFALLDEALRGDVEFLVSRLNQATIDIYGEDQCRQYFNTPGVLDPESALTIREIGDPMVWEYVVDGLSTDVDEAIGVEVERTLAGQTVIQEVHWQLVDGRWTWFTDCGDPPAG